LTFPINRGRDLLSRREAWWYQQSTDQAWPDTQAHNPARAYSVKDTPNECYHGKVLLGVPGMKYVAVTAAVRLDNSFV